MAVYQREPSIENAIDVVVECVTPTQNKFARSLKDVPTTIVPLIQCTITGIYKSQTSSCYPQFMTGRNEDQLRRSGVDDIAWLLVCHFHRDGGNAVDTLSPQCKDSHESEVNHEVPQPVPVWAYIIYLHVHHIPRLMTPTSWTRFMHFHSSIHQLMSAPLLQLFLCNSIISTN